MVDMRGHPSPFAGQLSAFQVTTAFSPCSIFTNLALKLRSQSLGRSCRQSNKSKKIFVLPQESFFEENSQGA
jgi:hypothetical protein